MELVSTFKLNDILVIFRVSFSYSEMFYAFVLRFEIFFIKFWWFDERMQSESFQGRLNDQNIARSKSKLWWHMSVIFDKFWNSLIRYKIDSGSFPSSKIGRRIRFWALEKLKLSQNSEIIEKTNLYDISRCIGNISANREHSPILWSMPELTAWTVLIDEWLVELIPSRS